MTLKSKIRLFITLFFLSILLILGTSVYFLFVKIATETTIDTLEQNAKKIVQTFDMDEVVETDGDDRDDVEAEDFSAYIPDKGMLRVIDRQNRVRYAESEEEDWKKIKPVFNDDEGSGTRRYDGEQHVPSAEHVLFCNSGSEATYHAIRLARAVTGRSKIIKFQGCYHGWHDYVARNMLSDWEMIGKRDPGSAGMLDAAIDNTLVCTFNDLDETEETFRQNKGEIAALIVEPIPHNIGCILPQPGFLQGLRELCNEYEALLIFDEVITGFRHDLGGDFKK